LRFWGVRLVSILVAVAVCFGIQGFSSHLPGGDYTQRLVVLAGLYITLAVSLNLINGITGQFSIGHAAFYQVGAYFSGYLTDHFFEKAHLPDTLWLLVMMIAGAMGAAVAGLIVGLPSLRLRGDYLAIVTLGFGEIIRIFVQNTNEIGGAYGMQITHKIPSIWLVWLLAIVCIAMSRNLLKTARGLIFLSVREDEVAASAMGVNVTKAKVSAFLIGSSFAGAAGALLAHYEGFITPQTFGMDVSFIILTMVVLGGTGSITGSTIAALFLSLLPELLRINKPGTGEAITVLGSSLVATFLAVIVAVVLIKRILDRGLGTAWKRVGLYFGAIAIGIIAQVIFMVLFGKVTYLSTKIIPLAQLRMVIFAVTLIVVMLLRPQGLLAHHEFSWAWVKRRLGMDAPKTAVST
jgi:branched-chain amino acid transport system permease protein